MNTTLPTRSTTSSGPQRVRTFHFRAGAALAALAPGGLCVTYARPTDHAGVVYVVEVATDLAGPWNSGPGFTEEVSTTTNGVHETVRTRGVLPAATYPQQFLRVRATLLP